MTPGVAELAAALHRLAGPHPAAAPFLALWPRVPAPPTKQRVEMSGSLPVLNFLPMMRRSGVPEADAVLDAFLDCACDLIWRQTYAESKVDRRFLDRYGWTEIIGGHGVVSSADLAVGLLLLGPHTLYPPHNHAAEELYIPVSGRARWMMGENWTHRPPNSAIHHAPHLVHATSTQAEPLLALYLWRGPKIAEPARLV